MNEATTLSNPTSQGEFEAPVKLPVHFKTLWIGVRSRRRLLTTFAIVSIVIGLIGASFFGKKSFQARTVLLYRPPSTSGSLPAGEADENDTPTLFTQMDMVKIGANLEDVRRRLGLRESIETIGSNIKVDVPINSSLMMITATSDRADKAANIANATRDVFLEHALNLQHVQASSKAKDLVAREVKVMTELHTAEQNLKDFTIKNHVVDLDKEAGWYLQQLINTELVYEEAVGQNNASQLQQANIGKIAGKLEQRVRTEEAQVNGVATNTSDLSISGPVDDAIRGRVADLKLKEIEMNRAKSLADDGIYSHREYEKAKAAYEQERFLLYKDSPSAALYKEMTLRELDVQLAHISDQQKVSHLHEAVQHVHERLDSLPLVQRDYLALSREVAIRAAEREHIDQLLGLVRREAESQTYGFSLVSAAKPPAEPLKSNRKLVFVALTLLGTIFGVVTALVLELADRRLRSLGDSKAKLSTEVLAGFDHGALALPHFSDEALTLTNRLRQLGVKASSRLMIVSATQGEGAPELTHLIAKSLAEGGDSVVLADARFRDVAVHPIVAHTYSGWRQRMATVLHKLKPELMFPPIRHSESTLTELARASQRLGLSDLLEAGSGDPSLLVPVGKRVQLIPCGQVCRPELLLSHHMDRVLSEVSSTSDILLVNTAPMLHLPDATLLATTVNQALVVAAAGKVAAEKIEGCCMALKSAGIHILGVVVTDIASAFSERQTA